jgi:hypothetical protein
VCAGHTLCRPADGCTSRGAATRDNAPAVEAGVALTALCRSPCLPRAALMCAPAPFRCYTVSTYHSIHVATQCGSTLSQVTVLPCEPPAHYVHASCSKPELLSCRGQSVLLQCPVGDRSVILGEQESGSALQWCQWASLPNLDVQFLQTVVLPCEVTFLRLKACNNHNQQGAVRCFVYR